jgi:hypothetical protein
MSSSGSTGSFSTFQPSTVSGTCGDEVAADAHIGCEQAAGKEQPILNLTQQHPGPTNSPSNNQANSQADSQPNSQASRQPNSQPISRFTFSSL